MPPLITSHAACKGHAPENTVAGIRAALRYKADAIEIEDGPDGPTITDPNGQKLVLVSA